MLWIELALPRIKLTVRYNLYLFSLSLSTNVLLHDYRYLTDSFHGCPPPGLVAGDAFKGINRVQRNGNREVINLSAVAARDRIGKSHLPSCMYGRKGRECIS